MLSDGQDIVTGEGSISALQSDIRWKPENEAKNRAPAPALPPYICDAVQPAPKWGQESSRHWLFNSHAPLSC